MEFPRFRVWAPGNLGNLETEALGLSSFRVWVLENLGNSETEALEFPSFRVWAPEHLGNSETEALEFPSFRVWAPWLADSQAAAGGQPGCGQRTASLWLVDS